MWEIRSQHCVLSREKETKKIKKEEQSHLTWLRSLFPMDGNQKLEGGRVERTGGSNAKERTWGEKKGGLGVRREGEGKNKDGGRRKKIKHYQESY